MRLLWIAPLLLAGPLAIAAEGNREYVGETQDGSAVYSYRKDRIEKVPFGLSVWVYTDAKRPLQLMKDGKPWRQYLSQVENWVISCSPPRSFYSEQASFFDRDGRVVFSTGSDANPRKAVPDSMADIVITSVCARSDGK